MSPHGTSLHTLFVTEPQCLRACIHGLGLSLRLGPTFALTRKCDSNHSKVDTHKMCVVPVLSIDSCCHSPRVFASIVFLLPFWFMESPPTSPRLFHIVLAPHHIIINFVPERHRSASWPCIDVMLHCSFCTLHRHPSPRLSVDAVGVFPSINERRPHHRIHSLH